MNQHQRPLWILIFAALLACVALRAKGNPPAEIRSFSPTQDHADSHGDDSAGAQSSNPIDRANAYHPHPPNRVRSSIGSKKDMAELPDGMTAVHLDGKEYFVPKSVPKAPEGPSSRPPRDGSEKSASSETDRFPAPQPPPLRPASASVRVIRPAMLDPASGLDALEVDVTLLDANGRPVSARSEARFELFPLAPVVPTDFQGSYTDQSCSPMLRWTVPLVFRSGGVANTTLSIRSATPRPPMPRAPFSESTSVWTAARIQPPNPVMRTFRSNRQQASSPSGLGLRPAPETVRYGKLVVRVSIPSQGLYQATTTVAFRPPVLVDTRWPYQ